MFGPASEAALQAFYQVSGCASVLDASFLETARDRLSMWLPVSSFFIHLFHFWQHALSLLTFSLLWYDVSNPFTFLACRKQIFLFLPSSSPRSPPMMSGRELRTCVKFGERMHRVFFFKPSGLLPFFYSYFLHIINHGMNFNWAKTKWHLFVNISQRRKWDLIGLRTMGWWSISGKMSFVSFIGRLSYFFILNYLPWCSLLKRLSYLLKMLMPFLFLLTLDHNHLENKCYGKQTDRSPFMSCAYHGFPQLDPCLFLTIHNCVTKNPLIINQQDPWKIWNTLHLQPAYISYHRLTLEQTRW